MSRTSHSLFTDEQEEFLREHRVAVLATGRKDGSPQVSHIVYDYDGKDLLISVKSYTAKWHNARRQPKVAVLVHEGRKQLVIYGTAEAISDDPERAELTGGIFRKLTGNPDVKADQDFIAGLDQQKRTVLRIRPDKASMND